MHPPTIMDSPHEETPELLPEESATALLEKRARELDEDEADSGEFVDPPAPTQSRALLAFVCVVSLTALTFSALFIARLSIVSGPFLRNFVERTASQRGIDIYIKSMRPKGLFDVRLEHVRLRTSQGAYTLDTRMTYLDVSPDVWQSLRQGKPVLGKVVMEGAKILIERTGGDSSGRASSGGASSGGSQALADMQQIEVVGKDVEVLLKAGSFATSRVFDIARIDASIPLQGVPLPTRMTAYGKFPDGVPFSLSTTPRGGDLPGNIIALTSRKATHINAWFDGQLPFVMAVTGLELCSGCEQDRVEFGSVDLELPNFGKGLDITAPSSRLTWRDGKGWLTLDEVEIKGMRSALDLELERLELGVDPSTGVQHGELSIRERQPEPLTEEVMSAQEGVVTLSWDWLGGEKVLRGELVSQRFSLGPMMDLLDTRDYLHQGKLSGKLHFMVDWSSALVELGTMLTFEDASLELPLLSSDAISTPLLVLDSDVLVDLRGRSVSLEHLELTFKDVRPLRLKARIVDAGQGWRFDLAAFGRDIHAPALLEALPAAVVEPVKDADLKGYFGFNFVASGHSAYPESLRLEIDVDGDVTVLEDGSQADIMALKVEGYPAQAARQESTNFPITEAQWVDLSALPAHVPRGLLAAEDAGFYRHNGFDFGGLARAMIHNLKVRRMERGGSTITQQLVKNLFLSRERTAMRKLQEAYLTWRIETELGKRRILELYLNLVHWGDGIYGVRSAANHYFGKEPQDLGVDQMSLLGTILPNPERFGGQIKRGYIASSRVEKLEHVLANLRFLGHITLDDYYFWMNRARRGAIGGLQLTVCRDDDTVEESVQPCSAIDP